MKGKAPQFALVVDVEVDGARARVFEHPAPHPFIQANITPKGIRMAWAVLFGRVTYHVQVAGTPEALAVIREGKYEQPKRPILHRDWRRLIPRTG